MAGAEGFTAVEVPLAAPVLGDILPAATMGVTAATEGWAGTRAGVMAELEVRVPAAALAARMAYQGDPPSADLPLAGVEASPARETSTPPLRMASFTLSEARERQGSAAVLLSLEPDGAAASMVADFILVSAGEDAGAAVGAGDSALVGESGIRFGIGPRTGIAPGGVTTIRIFTLTLTSGSWE